MQIKVLYNESHTNYNKKFKPQGGPSRFASGFREFFLFQEKFSLCPILFSHGDNCKPKIKKTSTKNGIFSELVYDKKIITSVYKENITKSALIKYLKPFLDELNTFIIKEKPDVVFLNGFSLSNWMLMYSAHKIGVPIVIQHAGIWKKEVRRTKVSFSPEMKRIFYDMERDTVRWCSNHIFLNNFSKEIFSDLYKGVWNRKKQFEIIPLPIESKIFPFKKPKVYNDESDLDIGVVARWDGIKNHRAILRLANAISKEQKWKIHTVTNISPITSEIELAKKYTAKVNICAPMSPEKLTDFYRSMDLILMLSNFDVSPTVVAESVLAGTPVIISDQVGWKDKFVTLELSDHIVSNNVSGKKLKNVIDQLMSKQEVNINKYKNLQDYIEKNHNPVKVFRKYASVFSLISK